MKEEIANAALMLKHTVAFRFCGKLLFGTIKKIDEDAKMATVASSIYPNPEDAKLVIPIESLIGCSDTASLMESLDYKDRFVAEYIQLSIRWAPWIIFWNVMQTPIKCPRKSINYCSVSIWQ